MLSANPFIVAEISGEHCGSFNKAIALIQAAKDSGVDAAKLQCFDPLRLAERRGGANKLLTSGLWKGRTLLDLYRETHTPREWFPELFAFAKEIDLTLFSSVFDVDDVDYLETLDCPIYKVSAFESVDVDLVATMARVGKPLILSIGNTMREERIDEVVDELVSTEFALLHCVSQYPCDPEQANLDRIDYLTEWASVVGFSDHTLGIETSVMAVREYGAQIIEKHFTLSRANGGQDAAFSLEPHEFRKMVEAIR